MLFQTLKISVHLLNTNKDIFDELQELSDTALLKLLNKVAFFV